MPIFAPSLPPRPALTDGHPPALVIFRHDLRRILRMKLGRFFGFAFLLILLSHCGTLYFTHLVGSNASFSNLKPLTEQFLPQGASFQAELLSPAMLALLWFQVALVGGGLVSRDTLYRIRPLMYAHPVTPRDYLAAKALSAAGLPFLIQLPFILLPWALSLAIAGFHGPVWATAPVILVPAALIIAALMGAVTLGASSLANAPRAGFGWALGILIGSGALGGVLSTALGNPHWRVVSLTYLAQAWPQLLCRVQTDASPGWALILLSTAAHIAFWTWIAFLNTRPSEAVQ